MRTIVAVVFLLGACMADEDITLVRNLGNSGHLRGRSLYAPPAPPAPPAATYAPPVVTYAPPVVTYAPALAPPKPVYAAPPPPPAAPPKPVYAAPPPPPPAPPKPVYAAPPPPPPAPPAPPRPVYAAPPKPTYAPALPHPSPPKPTYAPAKPPSNEYGAPVRTPETGHVVATAVGGPPHFDLTVVDNIQKGVHHSRSFVGHPGPFKHGTFKYVDPVGTPVHVKWLA